MERLSIQHGHVFQTPERGEEFYGRYARVRRTDVQGAQDGSLRLQSILQIFVRGKSVQASNNNSEGCSLQSPSSDIGIHVRRRGERFAGSAPGIFENGRSTKSQRTGGGARRDQERGLSLRAISYGVFASVRTENKCND